jgi:hypothetical protein
VSVECIAYTLSRAGRVPNGVSRAGRVRYGVSRADRVPYGVSRAGRVPNGVSRADRVPYGVSRAGRVPNGVSRADRVPYVVSRADRFPYGVSRAGRVRYGVSRALWVRYGVSRAGRVCRIFYNTLRFLVMDDLAISCLLSLRAARLPAASSPRSPRRVPSVITPFVPVQRAPGLRALAVDPCVEFLCTVRDQLHPRGVEMLDLVKAICRRRCDASPLSKLEERMNSLPLLFDGVSGLSVKMILRKLASIMLGFLARNQKRPFMLTQLLLPEDFPLKQKDWAKIHTIAIITAIVEHAPEFAFIPRDMRTRNNIPVFM